MSFLIYLNQHKLMVHFLFKAGLFLTNMKNFCPATAILQLLKQPNV